MLLTTIRFWWQFRPFWSPNSTIFSHYRQAPPIFAKDFTNIGIQSPKSKSSPTLSHQHHCHQLFPNSDKHMSHTDKHMIWLVNSSCPNNWSLSKWLDWFIGEMVQSWMSRAWLVLGTGYFWYFVSVQFHFLHSESLRDNRRSHDYLPMPKYSNSNSYQLLMNLFLYLLHSENTLKKS